VVPREAELFWTIFLGEFGLLNGCPFERTETLMETQPISPAGRACCVRFGVRRPLGAAWERLVARCPNQQVHRTLGSGQCRLALAQAPLALLLLLSFNMPATVHYVNVNGPNPTSPYLSWSAAARTIQAAVDAATAGDQILLTNGVYQSGGRDVSGTSNRFVVTNMLLVKSVNGPASTVIDGAADIRRVYLTDSAVLSGFTLTNGASQDFGGGAQGGTLSNCTLMANNAYYGGGADLSLLDECTLAWNSGSGVDSCILAHCAMIGNAGDGASSSSLNSCVLRSNGEGAAYSSLVACVVAFMQDIVHSDGDLPGDLL
jgi:hypothetical protein